jgi:hypothetical protein
MHGNTVNAKSTRYPRHEHQNLITAVIERRVGMYHFILSYLFIAR